MRIARTVKAKLLIAFGLILALNIAVGVLAFRGFSQTETTLDQLSDESLADIVAAMTLAHDSSALAALAPFVSSVRVMNELENESARLSARIGEFTSFVQRLPTSPAFMDEGRRERVQALAGDLSRELVALIATTKQSLDIRADLAERRYGLDGRAALIDRLNAGGERGHQLADRFVEAIELVLVALAGENDYTIVALESQYGALLADIYNMPEAQTGAGTGAIEFLREQQSTFQLNRRDLETQQRIRFLLSTIHTLSTQLGEEVSSIVETTSTAVTQRSLEAVRTLGSSKEFITLLGALAIVAAALAAFYVMRDLARNLEDVTDAMTRLAAGDRSASVPGLTRDDELGGLARAFNVFKDASLERESLAKQVSENSRMVEAMFSNMVDGICVFDDAGYLVAWNPKFLAIYGMNPEDVDTGMTFADVVQHFTSGGGIALGLHGHRLSPGEMLGNRRTEAAQFELHFADSRVVDVRSQPMPLGGFVTTYTDQTERRVVDRQLREAQRMEAVGQLTGGIAHDFNNLLAAISGNLQMLHEELYADQTVAGRLVRALDATERAAAVTQRLLAFARQQTLQPRMTDINALITGLLDLVEYGLGAGIEVKIELDPNLPETFVDPVQLENAILNLVFNSRDAMQGGGIIQIRTWTEGSEEARNIRLSVRDAGEGMSEAVLARIYEPFFTTKEKGRGTGLGLSMVYGFIKQSGGDIAIESQPGRGTLVILSLPCITMATPISARLQEKLLSISGSGERVLIVEDDPIMRATATDMVSRLGYEVVAVPDVEQAKAALTGNAFDLVFTDLILPQGMTGLDVADYAEAIRPGLPVLFTSGYARDGADRRVVLPPEASLIEKPYAMDALARALRASLHQRGSATG
ncbi:PAS-domain containing protein [Devosia sp.]|uniref:PAS-domain containing protein n=1 Tax=Devosia sp. TaxID=1871048 RepID=UPI001AD1A3D2|nr:PAS-domain containing protein [Devosia sp.]MBN9334728.1 PAS-domain containing protein [Devosia sp.]